MNKGENKVCVISFIDNSIAMFVNILNESSQEWLATPGWSAKFRKYSLDRNRTVVAFIENIFTLNLFWS